ncbi:hypothetical protein ABTS79_003055 [Salmonella enterica subsp. enterica]
MFFERVPKCSTSYNDDRFKAVYNNMNKLLNRVEALEAKAEEEEEEEEEEKHREFVRGVISSEYISPDYKKAFLAGLNGEPQPAPEEAIKTNETIQYLLTVVSDLHSRLSEVEAGIA